MPRGGSKTGKKDEPESLRKAKQILKKHNQTKREETRIHLGKSHEKWMTLKRKLNIRQNDELALFLIAYYTDNSVEKKGDETLPYGSPEMPSTSVHQMHSTPHTTRGGHVTKPPSVSSLSSSSSNGVQSSISGLEDIPEEITTRAKRKRKLIPDFKLYDTKKRRVNTSFDFGSSTDTESDDQIGDPDFDPDLEMKIVLEECDAEDVDDIETVTEEDIHLKIEDSEDQDQPRIERKGTILHEVNIKRGEKDPDLPQAAIIHESSLFLLVNWLTTSSPGRCVRKGCQEQVKPVISSRGSAFVITWTCANNHENHRWTSQPKMPNGVLLGDLTLASASLLSGNNFTKIKMLATNMKLNCISQRTYSKYQANILLPTIDTYYKKIEREQVEKMKGKAVILGGDGRMDSPGFSANYCTYTMFDLETSELGSMRIIDKRDVGLKSPNMEKEGFERCMKHMVDSEVKVAETVTDGHTGIAKIMREQYPEVFHSLDMWHGAKAIGKKVVKASSSAACKELLPWVKSVVNQFWRAGDNCDRDLNKFIVIWKSILHHVANSHDWIFYECPHPPMENPTNEKAKWLNAGSPAHKKLREIVLDRYLLGKLKHYTRCRSNSINETFNSLILMYAAKRYSYDPPAYKGRCQLAAIDYIKHTGRAPLRTKEGNIRYQRYFSKGTSEWVVCEVKEPKQYSYIPEILADIVRKYCSGDVKTTQKPRLSEQDPRRISKTLAPKPPPATEELVAIKKSRSKQIEKAREQYHK